MNNTIRELGQEAHEIICNIRDAARNGEITWQQRNELLILVYQDVNDKLSMARDLLAAWTGRYSDDLPSAD